MRTSHLILGTTIIGIGALTAADAEACGCFAPPTVAEPVVQAGERIVFGHDDGKVIAHIQIQYDGQAEDFAWMLPTPAIPDFRLGSEELFNALETNTRPGFMLIQQRGDDCDDGGGFGCGSADFLSVQASPNDRGAGGDSVAVRESSAGPYDYAVVRADEKKPMIDWLQENGYFVPAATDGSIDPYIRPGAYFLVLKLRAGATSGDLQPVVIEYESERPMIPIVLTSMGAVDDMGIIVWVLGKNRAIPHNYQHVTINEEYIDWANQADNYAEVVSRAVDEAAEGHAFVTEYAGTMDPVKQTLGSSFRFGDKQYVADANNLSDALSYLRANEHDPIVLRPILQRELDIPDDVLDNLVPPQFSGVTLQQMYWDVYFDFASRRTEPADLVMLADEIWTKYVEPTREAIAFANDHPYVTRMYTTMDPEEMTEDPVFAFNPDLPEISNIHTATQINYCNDDVSEIQLEDGRIYVFEPGEPVAFGVREGIPFAETISIIPQEGAPTIVTDNRALLAAGDDIEDGGCRGVQHRGRGGLRLAFIFGMVLIGRAVIRRRRK